MQQKAIARFPSNLSEVQGAALTDDLVRSIGVWANAALALMAIITMALWYAYHGYFPSFGPRMRFNCAFMLFMLAAAQWSSGKDWRKSTAWICGFVVAFSMVTLGQDIWSWNLGIDNFFITDHTQLGLDFHPGRMSPASALAYSAIAIGIALFGRGGRRNSIAQGSLFFAAGIAVISLVGYIFGVQALYKVTKQIKLSEYTALGLLMSCAAVFCSHPEIGFLKIILSRNPSGQFARRMLAATCLFPPLLAFVLMVSEERGLLSNSASAALSAIATLVFFTGIIWLCAEGMQAAEKNVIEEKIRAERASEVKTQFLANMSHEIRTPVGAILGFAAMLKDPRTSQPEKEKFLQIIERNSDTLLCLIDDILDLSRVEADKIVVEITDVSLEEILTDLEVLMKSKAEGKGISFHLHLDKSLPESISCDGLRLRQILTNVVGNAIKFTSQGRVDLYLRHINGELEFEVHDTGPGIEAANIEKLFKPFSQADASTTRKFGGSGLGLVLSERLCRLLGGHLRLVRSRLGEGSIFAGSVKAPLGNHENARARSRISLQNPTGLKFHGKKILLVDDAPDNRLLLQSYLKGTGADLILATNGEEAIHQATSREPDLILMDIQMPVLDGHAATRRLRELLFKKPIIALTAHAMKEERERCLSAGCTDYLTKPVEKPTLLTTIANHLESVEQSASL